MTTIAAHIQEWPMEYQYMNVPHSLMYIAIVYYLCKKEFYMAAWIVFSIIALVTVDFIIFSKKIFEIKDKIMDKINGTDSSTQCGCKSKCGCASKCGCKSKCGCGSGTPQPPATTLQPEPSQPLSQFTSQPSSAYVLEPGQEVGSYLEAAGYKQLPPLNSAMNKPPINSATVMVKH